MCGSSFPRQTLSQCRPLVTSNSKTKLADRSAITFSEKGTVGPFFCSVNFKGAFKIYAECQAFIDGVIAVITDGYRPGATGVLSP